MPNESEHAMKTALFLNYTTEPLTFLLRNLIGWKSCTYFINYVSTSKYFIEGKVNKVESTVWYDVAKKW